MISSTSKMFAYSTTHSELSLLEAAVLKLLKTNEDAIGSMHFETISAVGNCRYAEGDTQAYRAALISLKHHELVERYDKKLDNVTINPRGDYYGLTEQGRKIINKLTPVVGRL